MIRARDFSVEFLHDDARGLVVRVEHVPTGEQRESTVPPGQGAVVKERLIAELTRRVFRLEDFVVDLLSTSQGCFTSIRHVPSGRRSEPASSASGTSREELFDSFVEELVRDGTIRPE